MDLRQLEYVVAVADHGGFTSAARALHLSQPSLSHGVRQLEAELGVELFQRLGRTVRPSAAGERVVDAARRVLRETAEVVAVAASVSALVAGTLEVVTLPTLAADPVGRLVGAFRRSHPGVVVRIEEADRAAEAEAWLRAGRVELAFTEVTTGGRGLARVELFRDEIVAVAPPGTDLGDDPLTPAALARLALVATPPGTSIRGVLDRAVRRSGQPADVVVETASRDAVLPLVLAGAGTALMPARLAEAAVAAGAVVRHLQPPLSRRVGIVHRRGALSSAARAMIELARREARARPAVGTGG